MKHQLLLTILSFVILTSVAQVEVDRESFDNTNDLTSPQTFCGNDNSGGCSTSSNIFNIDVCTSFTGSGGSQSFFWAQDYDACGSSSTTHELIVDLVVPAADVGEITFEGYFGAWCCFSAFDANDSVMVSYSVDGGANYTRALKIFKKGGADQLRISDGITADDLTTTYTKRSFSMGSGHAGVTIKVKLNYYNLTSGSEGLAIDEFVILHTPPSCLANPGTLSK